MEPTAALQPADAGRALAPGAALLSAAPRLSWRRAVLLVVGFFAAWLALQLLFGLPLLFLVSALAGSAPLLLSESEGAATSMTNPSGSALAVGLALGALAAVVLLRRWGGPTLRAMGLRRESTWAWEVLLGAALGPIAFALVLAVELALGWATVGPGSIGVGGLLLGALGFTAVAVNEEVATRGFLLQVLGRAWNPPGALVASSIIFAALHGFNPNATPVAIASLVVAGLTLAWGYFATGRLWLPIAFHWSWNLAQGPLFGFPVSGLPGEALLTVTPVGPDWATGGAFGPEAGLVGLLAEIVVIAIILAWRRAGGSAAATFAVTGGALAGLAFLLLTAR
jgi:uncharacterized protein